MRGTVRRFRRRAGTGAIVAIALTAGALTGPDVLASTKPATKPTVTVAKVTSR